MGLIPNTYQRARFGRSYWPELRARFGMAMFWPSGWAGVVRFTFSPRRVWRVH